MTMLASETTLWTTQGSLPRVNLLPPEIAEKRALRRLQLALGAAGLGAVAVVGLLYLSANHSVSAAQEDLTAQKAQTTQLQGQVAKYNDVTAIYSAAAAAKTQLVSAMGDEVRYSGMLYDLSLSTPSNVWLSSVAFSVTVPDATTAALGAAAPIGQLTVSGTGFSHDDVAVWLESIAGLKTYSDPFFSNATEVLLGARKTVNFSGTAKITPAALSGRYLPKAGG